MGKKKYAVLQRKLEDVESQLIPILSLQPPNPETFHSLVPHVSKEITHNLHFINNLLSAEIASSSSKPSPSPAQAHNHQLGHMARRVRLLQSALRKWAEARPVSEFMDHHHQSDDASMCSCSDDDDDDDDDESALAGFKVYDNPVFVVNDDDDHVDDDDDDHDDHYHDDDDDESVEVEEEEEEIIRADYNENINGEEEEESHEGDHGEGGTHYGVILGIMMMGLGVISMVVGLSDNFADYHPPVVFLTPT